MEPLIITVLNGHRSEDSAYVVEDYPYGGTTCHKKYWIETASTGSKRGETRLVTRTQDPKTRRWNAMKYGNYAQLTVLGLKENGHVGIWQADRMSQPRSFHPLLMVFPQLCEDDRVQLKTLEGFSRRMNPSAWDKYDLEQEAAQLAFEEAQATQAEVEIPVVAGTVDWL